MLSLRRREEIPPSLPVSDLVVVRSDCNFLKFMFPSFVALRGEKEEIGEFWLTAFHVPIGNRNALIVRLAERVFWNANPKISQNKNREANLNWRCTYVRYCGI